MTDFGGRGTECFHLRDELLGWIVECLDVLIEFVIAVVSMLQKLRELVEESIIFAGGVAIAIISGPYKERTPPWDVGPNPRL